MISYFLAVTIFWIISIILVRRWLPVQYAAPILLVKFSIPVVYRSASGRIIPEYNQIAVDSFYDQTNQILAEGHTAWSLLIEDFGPIESAMGTTDPFYWWWNAVWISTIENTVYAPVLANVFVAVLVSVIATALVSKLNYSYRFQQLFLVFTLLHWELVTWSSLMNIKDVVVAFLTVLSFYLIVVATQTEKDDVLVLSVGTLVVVLSVLATVRFYIPAVIFGALCMWISIELITSDIKVPIIAYIAAGFSSVGIALFMITSFDILTRINLGYFPIGFFRYTVGPVPGGTAEGYSFLAPAAVLHWLFAPFILIGIVKLFTKRYERLLFIYAGVLTIMYATVPSASGPRFRLQIVFIIALLQCYGLWFFISRKYKFKVRYSDKVGVLDGK